MAVNMAENTVKIITVLHFKNNNTILYTVQYLI